MTETENLWTAHSQEVLVDSTLTNEDEELILKRKVYSQSHLDNLYRNRNQPLTICDGIKKSCRVSPQSVLSFFPIVTILRNYQWRQWTLIDVISGLSAGFIHLPQGLALGILASLQPVNGLYTSFFPIIVYLVFGTSPHVSMGTNVVIALLTATLVDGEAEALQESVGANVTFSQEELLQYKVGIASAASFIGGLILLGMGILRLGFLTNFLSKPFIESFTFSAAVHITTVQIVKMMHVKLPGQSGMGRLILTCVELFKNIQDTNPADVIVGLICMAVLLAVQLGINERYKHKMKIPVPIELIVAIISTIVSHFANLHDRFGIAVVGNVPTGIPSPTLPQMDSLARIAPSAFVSAILTFAMTISLAKLAANLHDVTIDDTQELVAYGLCQLVGAFFQNFPSCTAPPRTMVLSSLGSKSTLNGVMSALFILLVLLVLGQLFVSLPIAMLAAMLIVAVKNLLLQICNLKSLWHINKSDFFIWILTAIFSIFGDLDIGLLVGVIFSMATVVIVSQMAKGTLLGKADHEDLFEILDRQGISCIPGIKIFRFESALYYASQERFKNQIYSKVMNPRTFPQKNVSMKMVLEAAGSGASLDKAKAFDNHLIVNEKGESFPILRHLILDCSAMIYIDVSGVDALQLIIRQFARVEVEVWLANVPAPTLSTLTRAGFGESVGMDKVTFSVPDALKKIQQAEIILVKL